MKIYYSCVRIRFLILITLCFIVIDNTIGQTIIKDDLKYGIADINGNIVIKPRFDTIYKLYKQWNFYVLKQNGKYSYAAKHQTKKDSAFWITDTNIFDSIYAPTPFIFYNCNIGSNKKSCIVAKYRKNKLVGPITLEKNTYGLGEIKIYEAKYQSFYQYENNNVLITSLNGKYGLFDIANNYETEQQFDSIIVKNDTIVHVLKNKKWGLMVLNSKQKTIEEKAPCRCNNFWSTDDKTTYTCNKKGDTLIFYNSTNKTEYTPLINGKPFVFSKPDYQKIKQINNTKYYSLCIKKSNESDDTLKGLDKEIYIIDVNNKKVMTSCNEKDFYYKIKNCNGNILLCKMSYDGEKKVYHFYDIENIYKFSIQTNDAAHKLISSCSTSEPKISFLEYHKKKLKQIGDYNFNTQTYTKMNKNLSGGFGNRIKKIDNQLLLERISPIAGYKWGGEIVHKKDTIKVKSIELGLGLIRGTTNEWASWGIIPLGADWKYLTLPFLTAEYKWFQNSGATAKSSDLRNFMLNIGIGGGRGGIITFLPVPFGINGLAGISSDFKDIYVRGRISWDFAWVSIGYGGYYNLTNKESATEYPHWGTFELSIHIWRDTWF